VSGPSAFWASADFDGDNAPDLARVRIAWRDGQVAASGVRLFAPCSAQLPVAPGAFATAGLTLIARDVDNDRDQDLVLRDSPRGPALGIWLNDGAGRFAESSPRRFPAAALDLPQFRSGPGRVRKPAFLRPPAFAVAAALPVGRVWTSAGTLLVRPAFRPALSAVRLFPSPRAPPRVSC